MFRPNETGGTPLAAFPTPSPGGVRTAAADFNGDGVDDVVVGAGPGVATRVRVLDGTDLHELFALDPFERSFTGGVYVAAGDIDGRADLVISPDQGGGPRVRVFRGSDFSQLADFFGIEDPNFRGGARPAVGDIDGDGRADLVVAAGFGGGPRVAAFSGAGLGPAGGPKLFPDYFAFEQALRNGTFVAAGDVDGDGKADVVTGGGPGGGPRVSVFAGADLLAGTQRRLADFFAGDPNGRAGVRVAVKDLDGDRQADLLTDDAARATVHRFAGVAVMAKPSDPDRLADLGVPGTSGGVFVG